MLNPIPSGLLESIKQAMTVHRLPTSFHCILLFCQILFALRPLLSSVLGSTLYQSLKNILDHIVGSARSTARLLTEKGARLIVCGLSILIYIPFFLESSLAYDLSMRTLWPFCWMSLRASEHPLEPAFTVWTLPCNTTYLPCTALTINCRWFGLYVGLHQIKKKCWRDLDDSFAKTFA